MPLMSLDPATKNIFLMMIGILWFDTLAIVPFAELRLVRKSWLYAAIRTGNVLINIGLNVYLIFFLHWGIEAVFAANITASAATTLLLWILSARLLKGQWSLPVLKKAMRFGLPFVPAGLGYVINEMLDRFLLANYLAPSTAASLYGPGTTPDDVVGIYNACYKLAVFMLLLIQMFRMAWQPFFLRHSDDAEAPKLFGEVFFYFNLIAGVVFLGVGLFVDKIVRIPIPFSDAYLIGQEFWAGLAIVPILLGAYWFYGWYMNFSAGVFIREKTSILPKITLFGAVITIAANLILIPYFGMMGAASATLISYAAMAFMLYWKSRSIYPVPYGLGKAIGIMVWVSMCVFIQSTITAWVGTEWIAGILLLFIGVSGLGMFAYWGTLARNTGNG